MTQTQRILDYCKTHDGVTTLEASDRLRVCRLSERIRELEAKGYSFSHTPEHTENARVIRYRLLKAAPQGTDRQETVRYQSSGANPEGHPVVAAPFSAPQVVHSLPTPSLVGSPAGAASYKSWMR